MGCFHVTNEYSKVLNGSEKLERDNLRSSIDAKHFATEAKNILGIYSRLKQIQWGASANKHSQSYIMSIELFK